MFIKTHYDSLINFNVSNSNIFYRNLDLGLLIWISFKSCKCRAQTKGLFLEIAHFGTLENQIILNKEEHDTVGNRFKKIAALTKKYTPPAETCNTYKVTFAMLKEFHRDLHKHIHLENNILFPKAVALEKSLDKVL